MLGIKKITFVQHSLFNKIIPSTTPKHSHTAGNHIIRVAFVKHIYSQFSNICTALCVCVCVCVCVWCVCVCV